LNLISCLYSREVGVQTNWQTMRYAWVPVR
jgi:hypothetical protein